MYTRKTLFQEPVTELVNPDGRRLRVERNEIAGSSIYEIKDIRLSNKQDAIGLGMQAPQKTPPYCLLPTIYYLNLGITELRFDLSQLTISELEKWLNPLL